MPNESDELASFIEGAVGRDTVIRVLREHGVSISQQQDGPPGMLVLAKGDVLEARRLPTVCRKNLLRRLERKFNIQLAIFYNPNMIQ